MTHGSMRRYVSCMWFSINLSSYQPEKRALGRELQDFIFMLATLRIYTCLCMYDMQKKKWLFFSSLFDFFHYMCQLVSCRLVASSKYAENKRKRPQRIERRRMNEKKKTKVESLVKESFSTLFFFNFAFYRTCLSSLHFSFRRFFLPNAIHVVELWPRELPWAWASTRNLTTLFSLISFNFFTFLLLTFRAHVLPADAKLRVASFALTQRGRPREHPSSCPKMLEIRPIRVDSVLEWNQRHRMLLCGWIRRRDRWNARRRRRRESQLLSGRGSLSSRLMPNVLLIGICAWSEKRMSCVQVSGSLQWCDLSQWSSLRGDWDTLQRWRLSTAADL